MSVIKKAESIAVIENARYRSFQTLELHALLILMFLRNGAQGKQG
jgi:hypothetical protein